MNTNKRFSTLLILLLVTAFMVSGCAGKPKLSDAVIGDWDSKELTESLGLDNLAAMGVEAPKKAWMRLTKEGEMQFIADDKLLYDYMKEVMKAAGANDETIEKTIGFFPTMSYKIEGDKFIMTAFGDSQAMNTKLEGDTLTLSDDQVTIVLTKRK